MFRWERKEVPNGKVGIEGIGPCLSQFILINIYKRRNFSCAAIDKYGARPDFNPIMTKLRDQDTLVGT